MCLSLAPISKGLCARSLGVPEKVSCILVTFKNIKVVKPANCKSKTLVTMDLWSHSSHSGWPHSIFCVQNETQMFRSFLKIGNWFQTYWCIEIFLPQLLNHEPWHARNFQDTPSITDGISRKYPVKFQKD